MECPGIFAALFLFFFYLCPIWRPGAGQALALADSRILWYTQESTPVACGDYYRKASRGNGIPQPPPHSPLPPLFNMTNSVRIKNTILYCLFFILLYVLTASFSLLHFSCSLINIYYVSKYLVLADMMSAGGILRSITGRLANDTLWKHLITHKTILSANCYCDIKLYV